MKEMAVIVGIGIVVGIVGAIRMPLPLDVAQADQALTLVTPIVVLVLSLAYTAYWHAARSKPESLSTAECKVNVSRAVLLTRICGAFTMALIGGTTLLVWTEGHTAIRVAAGIDMAALVSVAGMIFLYVIGRGVE